MVRTASLFSQLIILFDRRKFQELAFKHKAERHCKGYSSWDHFIAMFFCQLAHAKSLREICGGLACCIGKLRHLGMRQAPKKSTLSYANAHRPRKMYQDLFYEVLTTCKAAAPGKHRKFRFKNKLLSMDSSTISLCLSLFPWAKFRRTKGAIKLHLLLAPRDDANRSPQPMQESYRMTKEITEPTMIRKIRPPCSSAQLSRALFSFLDVSGEPSFTA